VSRTTPLPRNISLVIAVAIAVGLSFSNNGFAAPLAFSPGGLQDDDLGQVDGGGQVDDRGDSEGEDDSHDEEEAPKPAKASGKSGTELGDTIPEISGSDIDGVEFTLSDYQGKVVMLDFWGDW